MNRQLLIRVILWQIVLVVLGAIGAGVFFGMNAALSCAAGGLCVFVPNAFFALYLIALQSGGASANPSVLLIFEFIKLAIVCLLFFLVAKFYPALNWPAMLFGIVVGALSNLALLIGKQRD